MRWLIAAVSTIAVVLGLAVFVAGPGTRLGLWDYSFGLTMIRAVSAPKAIAGGLTLSPLLTAAGLSFLGAIVAAVIKQRRTALLAIAGFAIGAVAMITPIKMKAAFEGNPFIHEVTTDFDNPPAIVAAAALPRKNPADYRGADPASRPTDGATVADAQRRAFPDIAPIIVAADLQTAAAAAKKVVGEMKMEILAEGPASDAAGDGWRIEAVSTSLWFGFKDDFIVRLTPTTEGGARVDLRSKSRVGGSDLGANAARVRDFTKRFKAAIAAAD